MKRNTAQQRSCPHSKRRHCLDDARATAMNYLFTAAPTVRMHFMMTANRAPPDRIRSLACSAYPCRQLCRTNKRDLRKIQEKDDVNLPFPFVRPIKKEYNGHEMRRTSLSPIQARQLGQLLRKRREERGLGIRGLAAASGVNISSITSLERGDILAPQPDTLKALAAALNLSVSDLFTVAGWLPAEELPTLKPYLRAKYRELDEAAIADLERYAEALARKHGSGPIDHEDEQP
jgi:transcriptional regulator with XRE-family HTH domain